MEKDKVNNRKKEKAVLNDNGERTLLELHVTVEEAEEQEEREEEGEEEKSSWISDKTRVVEENIKNKYVWKIAEDIKDSYTERKISTNSDDTVTSVDASDSGVDLFNSSSFTMDSGVSTNAADPDSDTEVLKELQYSEDEDEEPEGCLDIPTEENFLKSSTSVSGDDDGAEASYFGRPRSVHFEDEHWEDGEYRIKNTQDTEYPSWSGPRQTYGTEKQPHNNHFESSLPHTNKTNRKSELQPLSKTAGDLESIQKPVVPQAAGRPNNVKSANRESVRELLRRKREEVEDVLANDGRRRLPSNERTAGEDGFPERRRTPSNERNDEGRSAERRRLPSKERRGRSVERGYTDKRVESKERTIGGREGLSDRRGMLRERMYSVDGRPLERRTCERTGSVEGRSIDRLRKIHYRERMQRESIRKLDRKTDNRSAEKLTEGKNGDSVRNAEKYTNGRRFDEPRTRTGNGQSKMPLSDNSVYPEKRSHMSRSRSPKRENGRRVGVTSLPGPAEECEAGVIISKRDYAMFKSLVGSGGERVAKEFMKTNGMNKKLRSPKLGSQRR